MRRTLGCVAVLAACCGMALAASPTRTQVAEFQDVKVGKVWLQVAYHVLVLPVSETGKRGRRMVLMVPNESPRAKKPTPKKEMASALKLLKKDHLIEIAYDVHKGVNRLQKVSRYNLAPGEDDPMGYVFIGRPFETHGGEDIMVVVLRKYGHEIKLPIPNVKEGKDLVPTPYTAIRAERMVPGDSVDIITTGVGRSRVLTGISKYAPPFTAEFVKFTETRIKQSYSARIELKVDGEARAFDLATEVQAGKRRVPPKLLAVAKGLSPGMKVRVKPRGPRKTRVVARIERIRKSTSDKESGSRKQGT